MKILFAPFARALRNGNTNAKDYPFVHQLGALLKEHELIQVGVSNEPQVTDTFLKDLSFSELGEVIRECDTFIGVDSYLQHYAWYLKKPGVVLWGLSDPLIFGHDIHTNLLRDRSFLRPGIEQFFPWEGVAVRPEAFVSPEQVAETCRIFLDAQKESGTGYDRTGAARIRP